LKALTHHDEHAPKPKIDDFFANMSAAMNGGVMPETGGAPTIDISSLTAPAETEIDMTALDVPLTGAGKTMPLFALGNDQASLLTAPAAAEPAAPPKKASSSPAAGSLSPAALDKPTPTSQRPDSTRERKNVVAPATRSVPPAASQKRSGLAAPVLIGLAAVAGFLIWKRSAPAPSVAAEQAPKVVAVAEPAPQPETATPALAPPPAEATPPTALAGVTATPTAAEAAPETTPTKAATTTAHDRSAAGTPSPKPDSTTPSSTTPASKPAEPASPPAAVAPKAEPAPAVAKEEPAAEPAPPAEPAGPFDRAAAQAALTSAAAQASACRKDGDPSGIAAVVITFAPSGRVTSANVSGPPFAGTPTGSCIASALRKAKVPPFDGDRVTVSKTITIQ
jgi:hypothetical protein